jgi:hypothetical protein
MNGSTQNGDISFVISGVSHEESVFCALGSGHLGITCNDPVAGGQRAAPLGASSNTFANAAGNSSRMALEHHACAVVMGLHQPGDLYDMCIKPQ